MKIVFVASDLTDLETSGIRALLTDTANHLNQLASETPSLGQFMRQGRITTPQSTHNSQPQFSTRPNQIHLKVKGTRWNQYVFQFAHRILPCTN